MFNKEKDNKKVMAENTSGSSNRIVAETKFKGEISSKSDFRIDGEVEGNFQTLGKLVVGRTGVIKGTVICENADIEGKITGTLRVSNILSLNQPQWLKAKYTSINSPSNQGLCSTYPAQ